MKVKRNALPRPLKDALERFEADMSAISYVTSCEPTYRNGKVVYATWRDPEGYHMIFNDMEGWYEYERI